MDSKYIRPRWYLLNCQRPLGLHKTLGSRGGKLQGKRKFWGKQSCVLPGNCRGLALQPPKLLPGLWLSDRTHTWHVERPRFDPWQFWFKVLSWKVMEKTLTRDRAEPLPV